MNDTVTVREVMNREFVGVSESDGLVESAELLLDDGTGVAVALRGTDPVGVLTPRDVAALVVDGADPAEATVGDAMTESVPTVDPDRTLSEARDRMAGDDTGWLVVTDGDAPLGIVTEHDVLAGSRLGAETAAAETGERAGAEAAAAGATAGANGEASAATEAFEDQGICEKCGSLRRDLTAFNGQLLCAECRDI